jgi:teichuronic acid biosynthesis glycosyltransferase TuaH
MKKKYDIILNTLFRTDHPYSSVSLSFAKEMAKTHRVFYVNHPYSVKDIFENRTNEKLRERFPSIVRGKVKYETVPEIPENFIATTPPPTFPINFLPEGFLYDSIYRYNRNIVLKTIKQIIKDNHIKDYIYLTCFDPFFVPVLPKEMGAFLSIYQCIDDISTEPYVAKHGVRLEKEAVIESDITLVTSSNLWKKFVAIQPETYILNNAVDISIFKDLPYRHFDKPAEIAQVQGKIIGFVGNLDPVRTDYSLLAGIAKAHPDKTLLLVGPINSPEVSEKGLDQMPNVILTGSKPITEVPQYLKFMDVTILPSLINKMSKSVYPLKINEYLAGGKAVIATNFSDDIRSFNDHIYIANDHQHFFELIDIAVNDYSEDKIQQRMSVANQNTWGDRVRQFWEIIETHSKKTAKSSYSINNY